MHVMRARLPRSTYVCVRETLEIITIDFYPWDVEMLPDGCRMIMAQTYRLFTG